MSIYTKKSDTHPEKYFHLPVANNSRVYKATVFCRQEADGSWHAAIAFCAHGDHFDRRLGRQTARRKYFQKKERFGLLPTGLEMNFANAAALVAMKAPRW